MNAVADLVVKLGVVRVGGHTRMLNGKLVQVSGYSYTRTGIRQEAHRLGWDVEGGTAFRRLPTGMTMQVSPAPGPKELGVVARASLRDQNGKELYHVEHRDPVQAFTSIETVTRHFAERGRFPTQRPQQRDLAHGIRAGYPHKTTEEMRALLKTAKPSRVTSTTQLPKVGLIRRRGSATSHGTLPGMGTRTYCGARIRNGDQSRSGVPTCYRCRAAMREDQEDE